MTVVLPLTPVSVAVQVLLMEAAVKTSCLDVLTFDTVAVLVTDPVGPVVPWVLTVIGPELKRIAGPTWTSAEGTLAVIGKAEPAGGSVTTGAGPLTPGGPPKSLTLLE